VLPVLTVKEKKDQEQPPQKFRQLPTKEEKNKEGIKKELMTRG